MAFDVVRNDLTRIHADAVVLPSNQDLRIDGGAGLSVARLAGLEQVRQLCATMAPCPVGHAVYTPAFAYPAKYLIHTVGPIWTDGSHGEAELLETAYQNTLKLVEQLGCNSVALPLLSAGSFGFPSEYAVKIALGAIKEFCLSSDVQVTLCLYSDQAFVAGQKVFGEVAAYIDSTYVQDRFELNGRTAPLREFAEYCDNAPEPIRYPAMSAPEAKPAARKESLFEKAGSALGSLHQRKHVSYQGEQSRSAEFEAQQAPFYGEVNFGSPSYTEAPSAASQITCLRCGTQIDSAYHFCPSCGSYLADQESTVPVKADLDDLLTNLDASFSDTLLQLIDASGMTDAQVYRRANISRQHFSKIRSNPAYQPTKRTVFALCIALELTLDQSEDLLSRAGFTMSHASKFDVIVEFFITTGNYDIFQINEVLFAYDQPILG